MFRRIIVSLIGLFVGMGAADAQSRRQIDATPFSHAPCSVLDGQPCTPSFCSVFNDGPCIPEIDYPYGQDLQLTIESVASTGSGREIPQAGPRSRHDRRSVRSAAVLLVAAAFRHRAAGHADVGSLQLQAFGRDHRRPPRDLCHSRSPGRYPRGLSESDQCVAAGVPASEIHRWARRCARRAADRDPLRRQPQFGKAGGEAVTTSAWRIAHQAPKMIRG